MMVKEIEKSGIPVVHITALTAVALTVGSNRILQAVGGVALSICVCWIRMLRIFPAVK